MALLDTFKASWRTQGITSITDIHVVMTKCLPAIDLLDMVITTFMDDLNSFDTFVFCILVLIAFLLICLY